MKKLFILFITLSSITMANPHTHSVDKSLESVAKEMANAYTAVVQDVMETTVQASLQLNQRSSKGKQHSPNKAKFSQK